MLPRAVLALVLIAAAGLAMAHGDADWIEKDKTYRDPGDRHCCGVADCQRLPQDQVERLPGAWRYKPSGQVFKMDDPGVYPSIDSDFWGCVYTGSATLRCFFPPLQGT